MKMPEQIKCREPERMRKIQRESEREGEGDTQERERDLFLAIEI